VRPNMYSYTALISALARVGDWESAEKYFAEMNELSKTDPTVTPNRVTFSSMISAYEKAKKYDSAIAMYEQQLEAKIQPDLITYLSVIGACQASRDEKALRRAVDILENMHSSNLTGTPIMYFNLLAACVDHWEVAVQVLQGMQKHGVEVTPNMYNSVMQSLFLARQKDQAVDLAKQVDKNSVRLNHVFFDSVLKLCSDHGDFKSADAIHSIMVKSQVQVSPQCAGLIISAHMQGNNCIKAIESLSEEFEKAGVLPVLPARKEVVACVSEVLATEGDAPMLASSKTCEFSDISVQSEIDTVVVWSRVVEESRLEERTEGA
jgi:pentatricopeptide repeat protein